MNTTIKVFMETTRQPKRFSKQSGKELLTTTGLKLNEVKENPRLARKLKDSFVKNWCGNGVFATTVEDRPH